MTQANRQANLLNDCINSLKLWKELIETHLVGDEKSGELKHLEEIVKDCCSIDFNASKCSEACQDVVDHFNSDSADTNVDIEELYREKLANKQTSFNDNYQQQKIWKEIFNVTDDYDVEEVEQATNQNEQKTEYEEMQDSIFYSNVFTPPVDPISKMIIKDPYKNRTCGHVYEYKFILQYIKSMKNKAKCPYMGCGNRNITVAELVQDNDTKNKIKEYIKTNSTQSSDDD
ncbi:zf-Nse domain containing protein [Asbolus verrucosus]|uniref:E3 SUMO-protein ligase NSE2 n=1 Tax=Asbolus verrucosus TaxID=1661398 RepID=A0A482W256_ASBVE|nr:zf-Nse domain containing protein [Asbolus verrucosus]